MKDDFATFGREWLRSPFRVGAVAPSGSALARLMTDGLGPADGPVIELGPGTGVFTRALCSRDIPESGLALIEAGAGFSTALRETFPGATHFETDAARLRHVLPFGKGGAGTAICGLPLLSMPEAKVFRILHGAFINLRPGGTFRLFTYAPRCPVSGHVLARLGLQARRLSGTLFNLPPASVYVLRRTIETPRGRFGNRA